MCIYRSVGIVRSRTKATEFSLVLAQKHRKLHLIVLERGYIRHGYVLHVEATSYNFLKYPTRWEEPIWDLRNLLLSFMAVS